MRARLTIERAVELPDGAGGLRRSWAPVGTVFAALEALSREDRVLADRPEERLTHRITLRADLTIVAGMRFRLGQRVLAVRIVFDPDERGARLVCLCDEVTA